MVSTSPRRNYVVRIYRFLVVGAGSFPFKQLSRDCAWPATEDDAELIELSCPTVAAERTICLASHTEPNPRLWREAKWPVKSINS